VRKKESANTVGGRKIKHQNAVENAKAQHQNTVASSERNGSHIIKRKTMVTEGAKKEHANAVGGRKSKA